MTAPATSVLAPRAVGGTSWRPAAPRHPRVRSLDAAADAYGEGAQFAHDTLIDVQSRAGRERVGVDLQTLAFVTLDVVWQIEVDLPLLARRGLRGNDLHQLLRAHFTHFTDLNRFAPGRRVRLDAALATGVRRHVVLGDAAFGEVTALRAALTARGLSYVLRVPGSLVAWPPGTRFAVPARRGTTGRPRSTPRPTTPASPLTLAAIAATRRYRRVTWREGSRGRQASRFAAVQVSLAHRHAEGAGPGPAVWLVSEWPRDEPAPTKYYLSSLPATTPLRTLVRFGKLRWRIERDYQELKGELGLDHFEGRTWNGFHHHVALCAAAHAFLALRRALFPLAPDTLDHRRRPSSLASAAAASRAAVPALSTAYAWHASPARAVPNVIK